MKEITRLNNHGFVLAETLIVSVFLVAIFTMIYVNFYPIIGEYEKRENYDDIDGEYAAYWIKKLIEDPNFNISQQEKESNFNISQQEKESLNGEKQYFRFKCSDFLENSPQESLCINLVKSLEIDCDDNASNCQIYVTKGDGTVPNSFKKTVSNAPKSVFSNDFKEYINYLPDYKNTSIDGAKYRVIIVTHHTKGYNDYVTYSNIEVKREW